jgi:hypothetical protein
MMDNSWNRMRLVCPAFGLLVTAVFYAPATAALLLVDQSNIQTPEFGTTIDWPFVHAGQRFTPQLSGIDFVTFALSEESGNRASIAVNVRAETMEGPILGTTAELVISPGLGGGTFALVDFRFPSTVRLTPGEMYILELVDTPTANIFVWGNRTSDETTGGAMIGGPYSCCDFYFAEGIVQTSAVPEPPKGPLFIISLGAVACACRRRTAVPGSPAL